MWDIIGRVVDKVTIREVSGRRNHTASQAGSSVQVVSLK